MIKNENMKNRAENGEIECPDATEKAYRLCEWKIATSALIISLCVITGKVYLNNRKLIHDTLVRADLITIESITDDGTVMMKHVWKETVKYSSLWLPVVCGLLATYFTWIMVYLDSNVPGIQPPTPLSPTKYKKQSGHSFHLNYIFSIVIGLMITSYMYFSGVQIQY